MRLGLAARVLSRRGGMLAAAAALGGATLVLVTASTASANGTLGSSVGRSAPHSAPTGDFAVFSQCPTMVVNVQDCVYATFYGSEVVLGKLAIPITLPIVLQAGIAVDPNTGNQYIVGAINGETFTSPPQPIPGGLKAVDGDTKAAATKVTASIELAAPASSIGFSAENWLEEEGTALYLPLKIQLNNALLGPDCWIASNATPISTNLTTGTTSPPGPNKPITGETGEVQVLDGGEIVELTQSSLVDNSLAVPGVTGCGLLGAGSLDPGIDKHLLLASAAGHNTIIFQPITLEEATAESVVESE